MVNTELTLEKVKEKGEKIIKNNNIEVDEYNSPLIQYFNNKIYEIKYNKDYKERKQLIDNYFNIALLGLVGRGKTYLLKEYFMNFFKEKEIYYMDENSFVLNQKSGILRLRKPEEMMMPLTNFPLEKMTKVPILIYDDLGNINKNSFEFGTYLTNILYILNERRKRKLLTIFVSNNDIDYIKSIDDRLASRILGDTEFVFLEGEDKRKKNSKVVDLYNNK